MTTLMLPKSLVRQAWSNRSKSLIGRSCGTAVAAGSNFLQVSEEVRDAVHTRKPVVALETTIYTHGFPYPDNIALASELESAVRVNGGIPATIGVLNGVAKVGMNAKELIELLSTGGQTNTIKLSRRDLGYIFGLGISGRKLNGGTTVAATMVLAQLAGIKVFATGGLGGVHRGGEISMDVSADLTELGRTSVALISSGLKSFLDIPRTLEFLETQGVSVGTFADGRRGEVEFPAFWTRNSGLPSPTVIQNEQEAAAIIYAQMSLPLSSGLFFANPIPEKYSLSKSYMDEVMAQAVYEAHDREIFGSGNTPFILNRVRELTSGASSMANRVLVEQNVIRGTRVAVELAKLESQGGGAWISTSLANKTYMFQDHRSSFHSGHSAGNSHRPADKLSSEMRRDHLPDNTPVDVLVAGSLAIDLSCDYRPLQSHQDIELSPMYYTSNPAVISQNIGGVGHNVATALHFLGKNVRLCSAVGDDVAGKTALNILSLRGMHTTEIETLQNSRTAQYVAVNDSNKDLFLAMADMSILEGQARDFDTVWKPHLDSCKPKWLIVDANWDGPTLNKWAAAARKMDVKTAYEPVSVEKSTRFFDLKSQNELKQIKLFDLATPNETELRAMHGVVQESMDDTLYNWSAAIRGHFSSENLQKRLDYEVEDRNSDLPYLALELLPYIPSIVTKLGPRGVLLTLALYEGDPRLSSQQAQPYCFLKEFLKNSAGNSPLAKICGVYVRFLPPTENVLKEDIISVNGAGDTLLGVVMAGLAKSNPKPMDELVEVAQRAAVMTLKHEASVSPKIQSLMPLL